MKVLQAFVIAVALGFATLAVAEDAAEVDRKAERKDRLVCFAEKTTGSNLRKRICMTEAEREQRRKQDKAALAETRRSTAGASASRGRD